ncbi:i/LWEQ domain-containing protein [Phthorimaea operculella]|nr:i/LWEQ domain-containing protein [Phthorimaea operculella]
MPWPRWSKRARRRAARPPPTSLPLRSPISLSRLRWVPSNDRYSSAVKVTEDALAALEQASAQESSQAAADIAATALADLAKRTELKGNEESVAQAAIFAAHNTARLSAYVTEVCNTSTDIDKSETQAAILAAHNTARLSAYVTEVCNTSTDIDKSEKLSNECRTMLTATKQCLESLRSGSLPGASCAVVTRHVKTVAQAAAAADRLNSGARSVDDELADMDNAIEQAASQIEEMLKASRAGDTGVKLEVNGKILDACTTLMGAVKILVQPFTGDAKSKSCGRHGRQAGGEREDPRRVHHAHGRRQDPRAGQYSPLLDTTLQPTAGHSRSQEMLKASRAGDTGVKLEVNGKILDACTTLMGAVKILVQVSSHTTVHCWTQPSTAVKLEVKEKMHHAHWRSQDPRAGDAKSKSCGRHGRQAGGEREDPRRVHHAHGRGQDTRAGQYSPLLDTTLQPTAGHSRSQEMLKASRAGDTGVKLEVNGKILDACTTLMGAVKILVQDARRLQNELGDPKTRLKMYRRNPQWSEGLISAAKAVVFAAKLLVTSADEAVGAAGRVEGVSAAAHEVAGSTAQLVAASRARAPPSSPALARLTQASRSVAAATGAVVAAVRAGSQLVNETEALDTSALTLTATRRLEMESKVRALQLETALEAERSRLAALRKRHYQLEQLEENGNMTNGRN